MMENNGFRNMFDLRVADLKIHQIVLEAYAKILMWLWHCCKSSVNQRNAATDRGCLVRFVGELVGRG